MSWHHRLKCELSKPWSFLTKAFVLIRRYSKISKSLVIVSLCGSLVSCGGSSTNPEVNIAAKTTTIFAVGDIAQCNGLAASQSAAAKTATLMQSLLDQTKSVTSIITLGDNVYDSGLASEFQTCYEPTWGRFKSLTWATPGNHDYGVPDALDYFGYFGQSAGVDKNGFYSKSVNGWLIVSLNSNVDSSSSSAQYKWLVDKLNTNQDSCVMAVWHHPIFSSSVRGGTQKMRDLLDLLISKNADLVLQGHEHQFERFQPTLGDGSVSLNKGILSMVVGTGGAGLYDFAATIHPASQIRIKDFGVLQLELSTKAVSWKFLNLNQKVLDSGTLSCKSKEAI
jgi:acid phosphatase type 7